MSDSKKITEKVTITIEEYKTLLKKAALIEVMTKYTGYNASDVAYTVQEICKENQTAEVESDE